MSFNKITIIGNLGRDPELRSTPQGTAVCDFSVATNEKRKDSNGETKEETTWFRVTLFGRQAEVAKQFLAKGRQVYIEGRLRTREWTDREGQLRTSLEVIGTDLRLISSNGKDTDSSATKSTTAGIGSSEESYETVSENDIPF